MFKRTNAKGLEWPLEWRDEELLQALADVGFDTVRACITVVCVRFPPTFWVFSCLRSNGSLCNPCL